MLLNYFKKIFILFFVGIFVIGCSGVQIDEGHDLEDTTEEIVDDDFIEEDLVDDTYDTDDEVFDEQKDYVEGFEESVSELDEDDDIVIDDDLGLDIFS